MKRKTAPGRSAIPTALLLLATLPGVGAAFASEPADSPTRLLAERWQRPAALESTATSAAPAAPTAEWLQLDTGGSGGGFGNGDVRQNLHSAAFWSERVGWACGYGGLFKTLDGGLTWKRMRTKGGLYHLALAGPESVWILGGEHPGGIGKTWLIHTGDDGATWQESLPGKLGSYGALAVAGRRFYVLCGSYPSFRSDDGGETWQRMNFGGLLHEALRIALPGDVPASAPGEKAGEPPTAAAAKSAEVSTDNPGVIFILGSHNRLPRLIRSDDGGATWHLLPPLPEGLADGPLFRDHLFFATSRRGWLGGNGGQCWQTDDGGQTWQARPLPVGKQVGALWLDQLGRGFAAVQNNDPAMVDTPGEALYETPDGGATWRLMLQGAKQINAFAGFGPGRLWAVGDTPARVPNDLVLILSQLPKPPPAP